jgi:FkbH-like protein
MLDWLAPPPADFAARVRAAAHAATTLDGLEQLIALSQYRLDFLQTIQLNRALEAIGPRIGDLLPRERLAVLGSATLDHLTPGIRVGALRRRLWVEVHCGGYGQYRQEILDPASDVRRFAPHTVLFSIAASHAAPELPPDATPEQVETTLTAVIDEFRSLWKRARAELKAAVVHQSFLNVTEPLFGSFDRLTPGAPWRVVERMNQLLADAARADGVALLDIERAAQEDGRDAWFDVARMLQAKQEIAPQSGPAYGELLARVLCARRGLSKKCLVLDLDNTLWGGVLGDDGVENLVLGQGSAAGEAHLALQRYARRLRQRGVILAICSKNDPVKAEEAFTSHPEMLLKRSDVAAFVANWDDKARNLETIAQQLNIGIDSLVFVDDNPAERARVRQALPQVAVPELPVDVSGYTRRVAEAGYFEAVGFTAEDRQRADDYAHNAQREALRGSVQSIDEFLHGLQMTAVCGPIAMVDLPRVTQLINKTNQFNPTTRRYSTEQIVELLGASGTLSLQLRLRDRFGDNGLVSVLILRSVEGDPESLEIDTWVMSCRVFGRQLEQAALNIIAESARSAGVREIVATYAPSAKNSVVSDLYERFGFQRVPSPGLPEGASRWSLVLASYTPGTTQIKMERT